MVFLFGATDTNINAIDIVFIHVCEIGYNYAIH